MVATFTTGTSYFPSSKCRRISSAAFTPASSRATAMRSTSESWRCSPTAREPRSMISAGCSRSCISRAMTRASGSGVLRRGLISAPPPLGACGPVSPLLPSIMDAFSNHPEAPLGPRCPGCGFQERYSLSLFAHDAVTVCVAHVPVSRVPTPDRRNTVSAGLGAGDPSVSVVVPQGQGVHIGSRRGCWQGSWRC